MPLSKKGAKIKREMQKHYGGEKGEQVFYAMEHSHPSWRKSPETFASTTNLPHKTGGPVYHPDVSGGKEKDLVPPGVAGEFDVFHGDSPKTNVKISETDRLPGKSKVRGGPPAGVDGPFKTRP